MLYQKTTCRKEVGKSFPNFDQGVVFGDADHVAKVVKALDKEQLANLYERYGYMVLRVCREVLRDEQEAQDAMQDTFMKFWRFSEKLRSVEEVAGVLRRTALSCAIDALRARKRRGRHREAWQELRSILEEEHDREQNQERLHKEIIALLFQAVRVDEATLQMAYLYYLDEMTLEEVAQETGFSRRAVGMKLERFRENAHKYCLNHGISI
ncbi:MAG: sigma-70 family RNA polymerase sigma factor [Myxococcales bacterium]|nr:sigma-70 family RNA polymerase sigma factor [Myxococcales bacterium]MCB9643317.1 sigma-70 family RNA polymerase sigma factor [Myxococcales bacterium]